MNLRYGEPIASLMVAHADIGNLHETDEYALIETMARLLGRKYINNMMELTYDNELIRLCSIALLSSHGHEEDQHIGLNFAKQTIEIYAWHNYTNTLYGGYHTKRFGNTILARMSMEEKPTRVRLKKLIAEANTKTYVDYPKCEFIECKFAPIIRISTDEDHLIFGSSPYSGIFGGYRRRVTLK